MSEIYRLPQHMIYKQEQKINRPITVKLIHAIDKSKIFSKLKNLKTYNELNHKQPIYVSEHLPETFVTQK